MQTLHLFNENFFNFQEMFQKETDLEKQLSNLSIEDTKICN